MFNFKRYSALKWNFYFFEKFEKKKKSMRRVLKNESYKHEVVLEFGETYLYLYLSPKKQIL